MGRYEGTADGAPIPQTFGDREQPSGADICPYTYSKP